MTKIISSEKTPWSSKVKRVFTRDWFNFNWKTSTRMKMFGPGEERLFIGINFKILYNKDNHLTKIHLVFWNRERITECYTQILSTDTSNITRNKRLNLCYFSSRNGDFVGFTSSTAYGFTLQKMVALGFVRHPDSLTGNLTPVDTNWLLDEDAKWAIDVNGEMIPVTAHLNPPNLPIIQQESLSSVSYIWNLILMWGLVRGRGETLVYFTNSQTL